MSISYLRDRVLFEQQSLSCVQRVQECLDRIAQDSDLNIFITVTGESAVVSAQESDTRFAQGNPRRLEGMIIAIKDNISTKGIRTTCASKILQNFTPVYDATAIERLSAEGAIFIGKTNMDEFAMGSSNENSAFGPVKNPVNPDYVPGGSSGGSAAAVAAGMCHTSLGSDTGGSVRQPGAFCGVVALKPTYGRVSRYGLVAFGSSLDQIGVFAHNAHDCGLVLDVISGKDEHDATSAPIAVPDTGAILGQPLPENFTIAIVSDDQLQGCDTEVLTAYHAMVERFRGLGATIQTVSLDYADLSIPMYYVLATAEASSNLARYDGIRFGLRVDGIGEDDDVYVMSRTQGFGAEVKRRIMLGNYVLSSGYYDAYYTKALKIRRLMAESYKRIFSSAHALLLPASPILPFKLGEKSSDPLAMYLADIFTVSANLAGIPGLALPAGTSAEGLPIGMQLLGDHFKESELLHYAHYALTTA